MCIRDSLGPALKKAGLSDVKLMIWDHNRGLIYERVQPAYDDKEASAYIWGAAFHWYTGDHFDNIRIVHDAFPDKHLLYTEGGIGGTWPAALRLSRSVITDLNNWTEGWDVWNLILDQDNGPRHAGDVPGVNRNTIVNANTTTGEITYNPPHYVLGQFSRFIRPGAKRIVCTSNSDDFIATAALNSDGKIAVGVEGGGGDEVVAVGSADDAFGAGTDEAGELAQNVVRGVVGDFAGGGVGVDDGVSVHAGDIAGMTRAVVLVEDQVPDIPALGPVIEVGDDAPGEAQGGGPGAADAAFGVEEMFVGKGIVDDANVIEVVAGIPVEGGTPDVSGGFLVIVCGLDTLVYEAAIVIPDHELDVGEAGFFEGGPEEVLDEVTLFIGGEDAGFPDLDGKRLILNGQAPHGNALGGVGLDILDVVVGPSLVVFGLELAAVEHFAVGFHPVGGAPRRGVKLEFALGGGLGTLDERDAVLAVVVYGEILEFLVASGVIVGIHVL